MSCVYVALLRYVCFQSFLIASKFLRSLLKEIDVDEIQTFSLF